MEVGTVPAEEALQEMGEDEGEVRGGHNTSTHIYRGTHPGGTQTHMIHRPVSPHAHYLINGCYRNWSSVLTCFSLHLSVCVC
jgi:hypothetical protein